HKRLRYFLFLDQDHALRGVRSRDDPGGEKHQQPAKEQWAEDPPLAALEDGPVLIHTSGCFLIVEFFRHASPSKGMSPVVLERELDTIVDPLWRCRADNVFLGFV